MKMQPILATELPLEDKKDRKGVWLWVCLLGIALIGLSVWLYPTSHTNPIALPATHANKINSNDINKTSQSSNLKEDNNTTNTTKQITETKSINEDSSKKGNTVAQTKQVNLTKDSNNKPSINTGNINHSKSLIQKHTATQPTAIPTAIPDMPNKASKAIPKALLSPTQKENKKTTTPIIKNAMSIQNQQQIALASLNQIQIERIESNASNSLSRVSLLMDMAPLNQKPLSSSPTFNMNVDARALYTPANQAKGVELDLNPSWRKGQFGIGFSIGAGYEYVNFTQTTSSLSTDASENMPDDNSITETNSNPNTGTGFSSDLMAYDRNTPPLEFVLTETQTKVSKRYALVAFSLDYYLNDRMCISNIFGATYNFDGAQSWDEILPTNSLIDISQDLYNYNNSPLSYFGELRVQYNSANKLGVNMGFRYNLKDLNEQYPYSLTAGVSYRL